MPQTDRDKGQKAVELAVQALYEAIGTPPPAPGIERLGIVVVDAAYDSLREHWEGELEKNLEWPRVPNDHENAKAWIEGRDAAVRAFVRYMAREAGE